LTTVSSAQVTHTTHTTVTIVLTIDKLWHVNFL